MEKILGKNSYSRCSQLVQDPTLKSRTRTQPDVTFTLKNPKPEGRIPEILILKPDPTLTFAPQIHH